ncbi:hypothetical protein LCGC14_1210450 [marine sediment metagenome]|uniref:Peptidase M28 domain-containing protein n=1 Tax=marine sediment metagenome TaxID=412755 RepID=A0A0F9LIG6_9ZZZZ|nr:MAG: Peptidase family M28 [Candidatus Lokiarchaeum sp. GC14_75]
MIDEGRLLQNLRTFSFPRLSGTEFEKKSFTIAQQKIENFNLTYRAQEFVFSTFYSRVYPKISLALLFWIILTLYLNFNTIFTRTSLITSISLLFSLIVLTRNPEKIKIGKKFHSQNLYVKIPSKSNQNTSQDDVIEDFTDERKKILLFSHLDSKGQLISIKFRVLFYKIWIISFMISLLINIVNSFIIYNLNLVFNSFALLILSINFITTGAILLNSTNNKSKGAIDDASGISCLMELIPYYLNNENRLKNHDLYFVFTGAEESGTMGIRNFKSFMYLLENKEILILEKAKRFYIGTYSDGIYLLNHKFQGIGNGDKSSYNYVHSVNDNVDKIDVSVLKKLCHFYIMLLNDLDE